MEAKYELYKIRKIEQDITRDNLIYKAGNTKGDTIIDLQKVKQRLILHQTIIIEFEKIQQLLYH